MQPPSPTNTTTTTTTNITETVWEIEVARTLIEETDFLQGAAAHLSRSTDDPKHRRATPLASEPFTLLAEALYDLESTDNNRWVPGFKAGEVFELFDIKTDESGWLLGASAGSSGGREGFIPASYVSVIPEPARCVSWVDRLPLDEALRIGKTLEARKIHAMEILTTERTYVENLKVLNNLLTTLKDDNMGLTTSEIMTIFPSIETLKTCHEKLLAALEACLRDWNDNSMMGKIFIDNVKKKKNIKRT